MEGGSLAEAAIRYHEAGLNVLPIVAGEKRPAVAWDGFQTRPQTAGEVARMNFRGGIGVVCGAGSGGAECLDFDDAGSAFDAFWKMLEGRSPGLASRVYVERSPSGGYHVIYRSLVPVGGNAQLAYRKPRDGELRPQLTIETRGQGGQVVVAPTNGYSVVQGSLESLPVLTEAERELLHSVARGLDDVEERCVTVGAPIRLSANRSRPKKADASKGTISEFNATTDPRPLLRRLGWTHVGQQGENELWKKPGAKKRPHHATLHRDSLTFYCFSTNAYPVEAERPYSPFDLFILAEHNGDEGAARHAIRIEAEIAEGRRLMDADRVMGELFDRDAVGSNGVAVSAEATPVEVESGESAETPVRLSVSMADIDLDPKALKAEPIPTGHPFIDSAFPFGGPARGDFIGLAAMAKAGKTAFALFAALGQLQRNPDATLLYVQAEMTPQELAARSMASIASVELGKLRMVGDPDRGCSRDEYDRAVESFGPCRDRFDVMEGSFTAGEVRREVEIVKPDVVVIDYLQAVAPEKASGSRVADVDQIAQDLRNIAREKGACVWVLSNITKETAKGGPTNIHTAFRDSGRIGNEVTAGFAMEIPKAVLDAKDEDGQPKPLPERHLISIRCLANRHGEPRDIEAFFNRPIQAFEPLDFAIGGQR